MLKGKDRNSPQSKIQLGIELHRSIDQFADAHEEVANCVQILRPLQRKYAPVVVDILFDHVLACNWSNYSERSIQEFSFDTYAMLEKYLDQIPPQTAARVQRMINHNWLPQYASLNGMAKTFNSMDARSSFASSFIDAMDHYRKHQEDIDGAFFRFFPELIDFSKEFILRNEG